MKTRIIILLVVISRISSLNASIIYKSIDSTISATAQQKTTNYVLDLNNDGINDFNFTHINHNYFECSITGAQSGGEIQVNQNSTAYICAPDQFITEEAFDTPENMYYGMGVMDLDWISGHENILAVRFQIDSVYHYGWIKVIVPINCNYLKIIDCAYEDIPGAGIPAGRQSTVSVEDNSTNEMTINIFPNPTTDFITISGYAGIIKIYDMMGKENKIYNVREFERVDLTNLNRGYYIITIGGKRSLFIKM